MRTKFILFTIITSLFLAISCSSDDDTDDGGEAPVQPAYETMALDFSTFVDNGKSTYMKSTDEVQTAWNFGVAYTTVLVWNSILYTSLAVPVVAYQYSFTHVPVYLGDKTWEWSYTLDGSYADFSAKLTGQKRTDDIKWEMRVSYTGANAYEDFLWFEGTSKIDGSEGDWILYHSPVYPEQVLTIDWEAKGDVINNVLYTYVRSQDNNRDPEPFNGSTLEYGVNDAADFYYYNIDYYSEQAGEFVVVNIELNKPDYSGRIKSTNWLGGDTDWHCWDANYQDIDCN